MQTLYNFISTFICSSSGIYIFHLFFLVDQQQPLVHDGARVVFIRGVHTVVIISARKQYYVPQTSLNNTPRCVRGEKEKNKEITFFKSMT